MSWNFFSHYLWKQSLLLFSTTAPLTFSLSIIAKQHVERNPYRRDRKVNHLHYSDWVRANGWVVPAASWTRIAWPTAARRAWSKWPTTSLESSSPFEVKTIHYPNRNRIKNPLTGIPKDILLRDVEAYVHEHGLVEALPFFTKGALIAQYPDQYEEIDELDDDDRAALLSEKEHRWSHPKSLYFTIILNSLSAAIQGWDQTGSNGANLSFPQAFGIADTGAACEAAGSCETNSWIIGAINSAPYMAIALL